VINTRISQRRGQLKTRKVMKYITEYKKDWPDGKWLWIRVHKESDIQSIIELLKTKRKPKKVSTILDSD